MKLMKKQTTSGFAEISLHVPSEKIANVRKIIENMFALAEINYFINTEDQKNDDTVSLNEVFSDLHAGSAIKGLRYREELTQAQLADMIDVRRHHISEMENGKRPVGKEMAKRLAKALKSEYKVFL